MDSRPRIAYGCTLKPGDPDAVLTRTTEILGYVAGETGRRCWHAEIGAVAKNRGRDEVITAEVCMPTEHHLIEFLKMFDALPEIKKVSYMYDSLPKIATIVDVVESRRGR